MGGPQPGGVDLTVGARLYTCLADWPGREEVGEALIGAGYDVAPLGSMDELLERPVAADSVVLLHVDAVERDRFRLLSELVAAMEGVKVVIVGSLGSPDEFLSAILDGVAGFCPADASPEAIIRTLDDVHQTGVAVPRSLVAPLVEHVRHGRGRRVESAAGPIDVTEREWQILMLLLQRRTTREMAEALFVSVGTVRSHVSALLRKLGAVDREDAIRLVERGSTS